MPYYVIDIVGVWMSLTTIAYVIFLTKKNYRKINSENN